MRRPTIVFDEITVERKASFAFDVWHANHYLPSLLQAAPLAAIRRYGNPQRGTYLNLIEVDGDAAVAVPALPPAGHESVVSTQRFVGRDIGGMAAAGVGDEILEADILYPVLFAVPPAREAEFNAWYVEEHMGLLLKCPYWRMCRRFRIDDPAPGTHTHVALHYLTDLRALESPERDQARATPWRDRLAAEAWFRGDYRVNYRYGPRLAS